MKYKKGDDIYLKGQIVGISSCSEVSYPYEVLMADEFIDVREKDIVSVNEPEKPVVPQFVAEWLNYCETKGFSLTVIFNGIGKQLYAYEFNGDVDKCTYWARNHQKEIAKAWLYGYEVEKEKLYTVKFSNEDFGKIYIGIIKAANKIGISTVPMNDECSKCYFTKSELEEFKFWDNLAFEIEEVEK